VKEFWIYTGLRVLMFVASLAVIGGVWLAIAGSVPVLWAVVIAFLVSGLGSYFVLNPQRAAFARRVEARADRMSAKIDEMRAREDVDDA
jgi:hypothetical protein